jgi:hypothetical protein
VRLPPDELRRRARPDMQGGQPLQEAAMKVVTKVLAVLSVLALATPALACSDKTQTKSAEKKASSSQTVAKSGEKKSASPAKPATEVKPVTAAN